MNSALSVFDRRKYESDDDLGGSNDDQTDDSVDQRFLGAGDRLGVPAGGNVLDSGYDNHDDRQDAGDRTDDVQNDNQDSVQVGTAAGTLTAGLAVHALTDG